MTGVTREEHLRASHCKPWRDATNEERLDGENGLLLTPSVDHLFDRGFIGFDGEGALIVSIVFNAYVVSRKLEGVRRLRNEAEGRAVDLANALAAGKTPSPPRR